jgi:O-antigen ligase
VLAPFVWTNRAFLAARVNIEDSFEKNDIESHSIDERRFLNDAAFHIFANHPLTGTGLGSSSLAIKKYYEKSLNNYLPPHFSFLAAAMETGIFGAGCYLFLMLFPWFVLAKCKTKLLGQPVLVTTYALLLAMTVVSVLDIYPWLLTAGRLWQWLIWGLLALVYEKVALNKL